MSFTGKKRYFSKIAGSKFIFADGFEIAFHGGRFEFDPAKYPGPFQCQVLNGQTDPRNGKSCAEVYQAELEYLCASGNPLIFDEPHAVAAVKEDLAKTVGTAANAHSESAVAAGDQKLRAAGAVLTGDANLGGGNSDVNASTLDSALRGHFAAATSPAAKAVAKAKADAAAHNIAANTTGGSASGTPAK